MVISVQRKVVRGYDESGKLVTMSQDKLKSETSYKSLPLCGIIQNYLKQIREQQEHSKKIMDKAYDYSYDDYICVNPMGTLLNPDYVSDMFNKLLTKSGLRHIRYHDLRHSCATILVHLGFNLKDVQEWLGHSDFLITANTYTHVAMKEKFLMIDSMQKVLSINAC
jgi:site-specific recombinase XerD